MAASRREPRARLNRDVVWRQLSLRNMAQNELARAVGITAGYLSQLMSGRRSPSARLQARLAEELGIDDPEELFSFCALPGEEAEPTTPPGA